MVAKKSSKSKDFDDEAHYQGSKKVPMPRTKEYGTGLQYKEPKKKMSSKKGMK